MNHTEETIYGTTFAHSLEDFRKQAAYSGLKYGELARRFAATRAHDAVAEFRRSFETLVYDLGEHDPITETYREAASIYAVDGDEDEHGNVTLPQTGRAL